MQIITLNLNGVRAAAKKGFFEWLSVQSAEIVCVQELKAQLSDLSRYAVARQLSYFIAQREKAGGVGGIAANNRVNREGVGIRKLMQSRLSGGFWQLEHHFGFYHPVQRRTQSARNFFYGEILSV